MAPRLVQFRHSGGDRGLAVIGEDRVARRIDCAATTLELARRALAENVRLADLAAAGAASAAEEVDVGEIERDGRLLAPIDHPDPAHLYLTGTGLTHLGSAESRDEMHKVAAGEQITDSMRMFKLGLEGGKARDGRSGAQPEWFYKGDGSSIVAPGGVLASPSFALDGGEEPEIAGIYLVDDNGAPRRLGYALANEFSDHVTERGNYLWLAHSKLRPAALGAELLLGELPAHIEGMSRIVRNGQVIWNKSFVSGEANMSHSLANLEHHHFKYSLFRRPGDVHVHFFGTATLSFTDGVRARAGDVFEIFAKPFLIPLRNPLGQVEAPSVEVRPV
jgi:hypothetical protein